MKTPSIRPPFYRSHSSTLSLDNLLHDPAQPLLQVHIHSHEATSDESAFAAAEENARQRRYRRDVRKMEQGALVRRAVVTRSDRTVRAGESREGSGEGGASRRSREDEENPLRAERLRSRTATREAQSVYVAQEKGKARLEKEILRAMQNKPLPAVPPAYSPDAAPHERDRSLPWLERAQKHLSDPGAQEAARISDLFADSEPESETVVEVDGASEYIPKRGRSLRRRPGVSELREQARVDSVGEGSRGSTATIAPHPEHMGWSSKVVINGYSADKVDTDEVEEAKTNFEHIEAWLNTNALYESKRDRAKRNRERKSIIVWSAADLGHRTRKEWKPSMYQSGPWVDDASSSSSLNDERGRSDRPLRSGTSTKTVRASHRDAERTPRPSHVSRCNEQNLRSPPSTPSSVARPPLSSQPSRDSYQSDRSDRLVVQLEDLRQSVRDIDPEDDTQWVWKMYMNGLDRAQRLGLPFGEAQEQAMAATAYEVQEKCARALAAQM